MVRAMSGDIGMYFRFGGLAPLTHTNNQRTIGALVFNQIGVKFVFSEQLMLPVWFGTGIRVDNPSGSEASSDWGIEMGVALEYHFRIWRRISPFVGGSFGLDFQDPSNDDNSRFGMGLGPIAGIEYYIADRVSLTAMYMFLIQIALQDAPIPGADTTIFGISTLAGGALNITYYF